MEMHIIAILFFSAISALAATTPKAANDNGMFPSKCTLLLVEGSSLTLNAKDGQLVFDSKRRWVSESHSAHLSRLAKEPDSAGFEQETKLMRAEMDVLPAVALSSDGVMVEKNDLQNGQISLTLRSGHDLSVIRSVAINRNDWLGHIKEVSPGGDYVLLVNEISTHIKLVSTQSGRILFERVAQIKYTGVTASFSGKSHFTVNEKGHLDTYELSADGLKHLFTYYLGSNDIDLAEQRLIIPIPRDGIGKVHYLPDQNSYLAFYLGPEPLLIKLGKNSTFSRHFFEPAKEEFTPTGDYSGFPEGLEGMAEELEKPAYSPDGLINASGNLLFATRSQGRGPTWLGLIDIFSIPTQKYLRTLSLPVIPSQMALSPNERFLAVSSNQNDGVRIYDLKKPWSKPYVVIKFQNQEGSLLSFVSDNAILAGSGYFGELYRFEFPLPPN